MYTRVIVLSVSLLASACASSTVSKVGTASYAPLAPAIDVAIFTDESQVKQPYEVVANISYADPGKYANLTLTNAFEPLKAKAREVGANGVIIDHSETIVSGIISRGIAVDGRAIRLPTSAVTPVPAMPSPIGPQDGRDAAEALRQLRRLHDDGVINDQEYEGKKAEILRRL